MAAQRGSVLVNADHNTYVSGPTETTADVYFALSELIRASAQLRPP